MKPPRLIEPPRAILDKLRPPLNPAERLALDCLDRLLPPEWELYVQPHLNGLRPDFVLLNPKVGLAVYEVKGWPFDEREFRVDYHKSGWPILMSRKRGEREFFRVRDNPIEQIYHYKQELSELYCARAGGKSSYRLVTAGVICPFADDAQLRQLFGLFRQQYGMQDHPSYYPLVGRDSLAQDTLAVVFPEATRQWSSYMNDAVAQDLRGWLVEPDHARTQRERLTLNTEQLELATTRTKTGYRRIKGPAGSGKSLVLAARASEVARSGWDDAAVLVVSYNITLLHYLRDLAVRWPQPGLCPIRQITFVNFHAWCKRVCVETGHLAEYQALVGPDENGRKDDQSRILEIDLPNLVTQILKGEDGAYATCYDAVLVDEGQDFLLTWWNTLRLVGKPDAEMILVADTTQDIYARTRHWGAEAWTDAPMEGPGFRGPWAKLEVTYRLPVELTRLANVFARRFLPEKMSLLPVEEETPLPLWPDVKSFPVELRWIQTSPQSALSVCFDEIMHLIKTATPESAGISDITFLVPDIHFGMDLVRDLGELGYRVLHTFSEDEYERRKQKHAFFMGSANIKGTTIHSFKGWEARALVIYTGPQDNVKGETRSKTLLYTAMTRLKRHARGSYLTVVSAVPELAEYGKTWPAAVPIEHYPRPTFDIPDFDMFPGFFDHPGNVEDPPDYKDYYPW